MLWFCQKHLIWDVPQCKIWKYSLHIYMRKAFFFYNIYTCALVFFASEYVIPFLINRKRNIGWGVNSWLCKDQLLCEKLGKRPKLYHVIKYLSTWSAFFIISRNQKQRDPSAKNSLRRVYYDRNTLFETCQTVRFACTPRLTAKVCVHLYLFHSVLVS